MSAIEQHDDWCDKRCDCHTNPDREKALLNEIERLRAGLREVTRLRCVDGKPVQAGQGTVETLTAAECPHCIANHILNYEEVHES